MKRQRMWDQDWIPGKYQKRSRGSNFSMRQNNI